MIFKAVYQIIMGKTSGPEIVVSFLFPMNPFPL